MLGLAVWTEFDFLFEAGAVIAFAGFIPLFGGIANLLQRAIGRRALKHLVVSAVVLIILGCGTFLALVAAGVVR